MAKEKSGAARRRELRERGLANHPSLVAQRARNALRLAARIARCESNRSRLDKIKLATGCVDCGYNSHPAALEYDHLPGTVKTATVARLRANQLISWERITTEIEKCELVCANCHRIRTHDRRHKIASAV